MCVHTCKLPKFLTKAWFLLENVEIKQCGFSKIGFYKQAEESGRVKPVGGVWMFIGLLYWQCESLVWQSSHSHWGEDHSSASTQLENLREPSEDLLNQP